MVSQIYRCAESGCLKIAVGTSLIDTRCNDVPMCSELTFNAERQVVLYVSAVSVCRCACRWVGILPFFELVEQGSVGKQQPVLPAHCDSI